MPLTRKLRRNAPAQIVDATYDAAERLNDLKRRYGRITPARAAGVSARLREARALRRKLAAGYLDPATHAALVGEIRAFSEGTINDKAELFARAGWLTVIAVVIAYELATIGTMVVLATTAHAGARALNTQWFDRFGHAVAGVLIVTVGAAMAVLGI